MSLNVTPPPQRPTIHTASIVHRLKSAFQLWLLIVPHMPRMHRSTIGARIGNAFLDIIETAYHAYYATGRAKIEKIIYALVRLDSMKFLLAIAWENALIQNKQYEDISLKLDEIGKMLGGWKKGIEAKLAETKTPR